MTLKDEAEEEGFEFLQEQNQLLRVCMLHFLRFEGVSFSSPHLLLRSTADSIIENFVRS